MENKNIILIILSIIVIYLLFCDLNKISERFKQKKQTEQKETFSDTDTNIDHSIINLAIIMNNINKPGELVIPVQVNTFNTNLSNNDNPQKLLTVNDNSLQLNGDSGDTNIIIDKDVVFNAECWDHMIAPFYVDFTNTGEITKLQNNNWYLCDGKNETPDLVNRFIYGGSASGGKNYNSIGGEERHQLTINEIPDHIHSLNFQGEFGHSGSYGDTKCNGQTGRNTDRAGNDESHDNMPPYMVLAYFMYKSK